MQTQGMTGSSSTLPITSRGAQRPTSVCVGESFARPVCGAIRREPTPWGGLSRRASLVGCETCITIGL